VIAHVDGLLGTGPISRDAVAILESESDGIDMHDEGV